MRIFARVAAVQNLSSVGSELGLTPGTISKRIQALEEELSVRLFDRTTRSIRITAEGTVFLAHVERILEEVDSARAAMADSAAKPKGPLKIAAPHALGPRFIMPAVLNFMPIHPEIDVQIDLSDRGVSLQDDGYDVAIHVGRLSDSSIIAKRLAPDSQVLVASRQYLETSGYPEQPSDLTRHSCLVFNEQSAWTLGKAGVEQIVRVTGRLKSDNMTMLRNAAQEGYGILCTTELQVIDELKSGQLIRVLADCAPSGDVAVWALYPSGKHILPRLRVFLDFLGEWFREARAEILGAGPLRFGPGVARVEGDASVRPIRLI